MPAMSPEETLAIIALQFEEHDYPYVLDSGLLMQSSNGVMVEAISKSPDRRAIVLDATGTFNERIEALHTDTTRDVKIEGESLAELDSAALAERMRATFGAQADEVVKSYSQNFSYMGITPVNFGFPGQSPEEYYVRLGDKNENIFMANTRALRTVQVDSMLINVPQDPDYLRPEKQQEYANAQTDAETTREAIQRKIMANDTGKWKFKYNLKLLGAPTPKGYKIIAIGTDSPLIAAIYQGRGDPIVKFDRIVASVLDIQNQATSFLGKLSGKLVAAKAAKIETKSEANEKKITSIKIVLQKIDYFKAGEITFNQLVKGISDLAKIARDIAHTGPVSTTLNTLGMKKESGTTAALNHYAAQLESLLNNLEMDAKIKPAFNRIEDNLKEYLNTRDTKMSFISRKFDNARGDVRANAYLNLWSQVNSDLGRAIVLTALLNGKGKEIKNSVFEAFPNTTEENIRQSLAGIIRNEMPDAYHDQMIKDVIKKIADKTDSKTAPDLSDEVLALNSLERGTHIYSGPANR